MVVMTVIDDQGVHHERPRVDRMVVNEAISSASTWVVNRPHEGGRGAPLKCLARTDRTAIIERIKRQGAVDTMRAEFEATTFDAELMEREYVERPDLEVTVLRMWLQWLESVERCPVGSLRALYAELEARSTLYSRHALMGVGGMSRVLATAALHAAEACADRIADL